MNFMNLVYVFGFDAAVHPENPIWDELEDDPLYGRLSGMVRSWVSVANGDEGSSELYLDVRGERFPGRIARLTMADNPYTWVNGVAMPMSENSAEELDGEHAGRFRRSNDLRAFFNARLKGPLFAYLPIGKEADGEAVIPEIYWHRCQETFAFLDDEGWPEFLLTTELTSLKQRRIYPVD